MDKLNNCKKADLIEKLKDDLKTALKVAEEIEDLEAKSMAYLHLFIHTRDEKFLKKAVDYAIKCEQRDGMLLLIVEKVSKIDRRFAEAISELIKKEYYRNKAFSVIIENCEAMELISKVSCKKTLSAALKRLALRKRSVKIALEIPDPYYKAVALLNLAPEFNNREMLDKIGETISSVENKYLRKRLMRKLESIQAINGLF